MCCHLEGTEKTREMDQKESQEIQRREMSSPAPEEVQPHELFCTGTDWSLERAGGSGGQQVESEPSVCPCNMEG